MKKFKLFNHVISYKTWLILLVFGCILLDSCKKDDDPENGIIRYDTIIQRTTIYDTITRQTIVIDTATVSNYTVEINKIFSEHQGAKIAFVSPDFNVYVHDNELYKCYSNILDALKQEYKAPSELVIVVLPGVYYETINLKSGTNVSFIGVDKKKCIVKNKEYDGYYHPPFWICPGVTIKDLTIICEKKGDYAEGTPTLGAYCIHTDNDGKGSVSIENCILYSEQHACIGFGTRENAPLYIKDCIMKSKNSFVLYGHSSVANTNKEEEIHISGCYGISEKSIALYIFDANHFTSYGGKKSKDILLFMNDNTFINSDGTFPTSLSPAYKEDTDDANYYTKYIRRMPSNSNNSGDYLNSKK